MCASSAAMSAAPTASRSMSMATRWRDRVMALLLGRPVKFVADRLESFVSDIHAREHRVRPASR